MTWSDMAAAIVACAMCTTVSGAAQLGEIARQEAERRKTIKSSGRTYTNDSLRPAPTESAPASAQPAAETPAPPAAYASPATIDEAEARKKDEARWRARIAGERDALARAKSFADALQSRINALYTDFVNRDDPVQRSEIAVEREKSLAELERLQKEIQVRTKAIAGIQDEARRAGVPAGWVR